ncbi:RlpA-like double-psi beta-barrel domain-containing protein [Bradyrhizobium sp. McL0616]|uniref:RlpA-like double-psi beta-barrel domain-containing protein n=1 Tax=Bradyrhizobium sp. McL0616 TaxID=3415674 RepID=UPI003CEFB0FD
MRLLFGIVAIAMAPTWMGLTPTTAVAQEFNDSWSIIPKAHAEPAPEAPNRTSQPQTEGRTEQQPARSDRSTAQSFARTFSGKASFYSYANGKTASGSSFDRNELTAAHRNFPVGTKVRVTRGDRSVVS